MEEMLVMQALWTHARLARLTGLASQPHTPSDMSILNELCERAANTFRRQMLALSEYRNPRKGDSFIAVKQANLAQQQVVQNVENGKPQMGNTTNEQGSTGRKMLSAHEAGIEISAVEHLAKQAVAGQHGTQDGSGQGTLGAKRFQAR